MSKTSEQQNEMEDLEWIEEEPMDRIGHGTDIYDPEQREEMLEDNGITAVENAFMDGRERARSKKKHSVWK